MEEFFGTVMTFLFFAVIYYLYETHSKMKNLSEALQEKQSRFHNNELFDLETKLSTRLTKLEKAIDSLKRHDDWMDENLYHGDGRVKVDEGDIEKVLEPIMLRLKDVEIEIQDLDDDTTNLYGNIRELATKDELWQGQLEISSRLGRLEENFKKQPELIHRHEPKRYTELHRRMDELEDYVHKYLNY